MFAAVRRLVREGRSDNRSIGGQGNRLNTGWGAECASHRPGAKGSWLRGTQGCAALPLGYYRCVPTGRGSCEFGKIGGFVDSLVSSLHRFVAPSFEVLDLFAGLFDFGFHGQSQFGHFCAFAADAAGFGEHGVGFAVHFLQ